MGSGSRAVSHSAGADGVVIFPEIQGRDRGGGGQKKQKNGNQDANGSNHQNGNANSKNAHANAIVWGSAPCS